MDVAELGLSEGERVRFRRRAEGRWTDAVVVGRERDGSVALRDPKGASRALPVACIEVRVAGPRGGQGWESLVDRAARDHPSPRGDQPGLTGTAEQLTLL